MEAENIVSGAENVAGSMLSIFAYNVLHKSILTQEWENIDPLQKGSIRSVVNTTYGREKDILFE